MTSFFQMGSTHQSLAHQGPEMKHQSVPNAGKYSHSPNEARFPRWLKIACCVKSRGLKRSSFVISKVLQDQMHPSDLYPEALLRTQKVVFLGLQSRLPQISMGVSSRPRSCCHPAMSVLGSRQDVEQCRGPGGQTQSDPRCVVFPDSIVKSL